MLKIYCKICGSEVESHPTQLRTCICKNAKVKDDLIFGDDLTKIQIVSNTNSNKKKIHSVFSDQELEFQENRRKRKVRKLSYEVK